MGSMKHWSVAGFHQRSTTCRSKWQNCCKPALMGSAHQSYMKKGSTSLKNVYFACIELSTRFSSSMIADLAAISDSKEDTGRHSVCCCGVVIFRLYAYISVHKYLVWFLSPLLHFVSWVTIHLLSCPRELFLFSLAACSWSSLTVRGEGMALLKWCGHITCFWEPWTTP